MSRSYKNKTGVKSTRFSISQNFLTSRRIIEKIIGKAKINKNDTVIEIGSGKGHITRVLAEKSRKVIAYEIDPKFYFYLKETASKYENLSLFNVDFLKCTLPRSEYKVFANIPFSITSDIISKLTSSINIPSDSWLIMEKGAAKRFMGGSKQTTYYKNNLCETKHSLLLKPFFDMKITHYFDRQDFHPMPGVDTIMLHIRKKPQPDINFKYKAVYENFINHSIKYGLFGKNALLTKKQINTALRLENLLEIEPSGDVLYIQWLCLFRCWLKFNKNILK